jgi:murein DD-endopeptidase MepM/ murein hydrolase activator NlpD
MAKLRSVCKVAGLALVGMLMIGSPSPADTTARDSAQGAGVWSWPLKNSLVDRVFEAPAERYGPGHRGLDLRPHGTAARTAVLAPADGTVAFSGPVAGRGILTIDHGSGFVTTLEPVQSELSAGTAVLRGAEVAVLGSGGHSRPGTLHFGVRLHGEYINPLLLLGKVPRAVLLPCC